MAVLFALLTVVAFATLRASAADRATVHVNITVLPFAAVDIPPDGNGQGTGFILHVPSKRCSILGAFLGLLTGAWTGPWQNAWSRERYSEDNYCRHWFADWAWPVIRPVRIPFTVTGNAQATVTVTPSSFLKLVTNRYLGKALAQNGDPLGYQSVVHFPVPSAGYAWLRGWESYEDWNDWRGWGGFGSLPAWSRWAKLPGINGAGTPPLSADMVLRGMKAWGVIYIVARRDWTSNGKPAHPGDYAGAVDLTITAENR
ncbi:MAG TPA: hypothetical protein VG757_10710 [Devosia sp.]|nr:hypothetical protein [Devosia sp.]